MCGFTFRKSILLRGQNGYLRHRGPDQQSYFSGEDFELEFSRLTITGTIEGDVPVYSTNGEWLVAFNGEIYNFRTLIESHALPYTDSDTKVIANGLEKFGLNFLLRLRGMYAGIIMNTRTKDQYVFRDPLGEKPLFFSRLDSDLVIASEFTSLLKLLARPISHNPKAVSDFFRFGYVEEPDTFDKDIASVKRGVVLKIESNGAFSEVLTLTGFDSSETSLDLRDLLHILNSEVSYSTVPTGLALSAGIDSTSILYAMSKYRNTEFLPLIMNIDTNGLSEEASHASNACKVLGIKPHVIQSVSKSGLLDALRILAISNDQPHSDPSGLSYLSIFQTASEIGLKVVLLGHGPDELFWGYPWYNSQLLKTQKTFLPKPLTRREYWNSPAKNSRLLYYFGSSRNELNGRFSNDPFLTSANPWEKFRAEMVHSYLSSNGLRQSDRLAMSCGIEPRTPYGDSRLYGWSQVNSIASPASFDKSEFRNAVELGPLEATRIRKKQGFDSPMGSWFGEDKVNEFAEDCLGRVINMDLDWRVNPRLSWLSPSERYRIIMLGGWLDQFA